MNIKLNSILTGVYINMGLTYDEKKKDYGKALECYEKAIEIEPDSSDAHFNAGIVYAKMKEFDRAIAYFEMAIKYNERDFEAYWYMGLCYRNKGEADKQAACLQKAARYFVWQNQYFEVDTFVNPVLPFALLEIEGVEKHENINFPPFIRVLEDITNNK
jgi:tetratricopeptide (TPR) repeat protein